MPTFRITKWILAFLLCFLPGASWAQAASAAERDAIVAMLNRQAADWNGGDLNAFATGYKHSPDILFMGQPIRRGYDQMLASYRDKFSNRDKMGKLTFTQLEVQPLDEHFATVTGRFYLERTRAGGGDASGYFLLVLEKTPSGWKIICDDTTGDAKAQR